MGPIEEDARAGDVDAQRTLGALEAGARFARLGRGDGLVKTPEQWADRLVCDVATVTQMDPDKGHLANVEDWKRNADAVFRLAMREAHDDAIEKAARMAHRAGDDGLVERIRSMKVGS
jgi:hypothetical protein